MNIKECTVCKGNIFNYYPVKVDGINAGVLCRKCIPKWHENLKIWGWSLEVFYKNIKGEYTQFSIFALEKFIHEILRPKQPI